MMIILKASKVNLFVSSVLFVLWYHSPKILDTPHKCNISRLRVNKERCQSNCNINVHYLFVHMVVYNKHSGITFILVPLMQYVCGSTCAFILSVMVQNCGIYFLSLHLVGSTCIRP
jgi:hypothetical protein